MIEPLNREQQLRYRIKGLTWLFIIGLVLSGVTAIPLVTELDLLAKWFGFGDEINAPATSEVARWFLTVREALRNANAHQPFLFYGTDWLAFGHFVIAIAFVGALRDPVRNRWLFDFGLVACVLVIPFALVCGGGCAGFRFGGGSLIVRSACLVLCRYGFAGSGAVSLKLKLC